MVQLSNWTVEKVYEELKKENINLSTKFGYSHPNKTNNASKKLSIGRIWFNCLLPDDFELIDKPIDKKDLDKIFFQFINKYPPEECCELINKIKKEAFRLGTIEPRTMSIDMFLPSEEWKDKKSHFTENSEQLNDKEFNKQRQQLIDDLETELKNNDVKFMEALNSKSSGKLSKTTWETLQVSKGSTVDIEDNITRISKAITDGYNIEEYYKAASEARNGFFIKSTAVQDPGYLARKVVMANANIKLDQKDCKSKRYLEIYLDPNRANTFIGRYMVNDKNELELITDVKDLINKNIKVRSPFYCKSSIGICKTCYGELGKKIENENIGILAAGAINMEAVNAMMKLRHKSEKVQVIDVNFIDIFNKSTVKLINVQHVLDVQEKEIYAKKDISIIIDTHEYDEKSFIEYEDKYVLPGLLTITNGTENREFIFLPLGFDVNLYKPESLIKNGRFLELNFIAGEKIISKDKYMKMINPALITKILDGVTKYIKDPKMLLDMLIGELPGMDSCHLETTISNLFRSESNLKLPARLNNYKDPVIIGVKQIPFIDSWLNGLAFQEINKAIEMGLVNEEDAVMNPIEKILVRENYKD